MLLFAVALTALAGVLIAVSGSRYKKDKTEGYEFYLENERQANFARKRDIEGKYFFTPDTSKLPIREYPDTNTRLARKQEAVLKQAEKKMLRFDRRITNIELKQSYGRANLESIIVYEENYGAYIRALTDWAGELITEQSYDDGGHILEECVRLGSELSKSYTLLADEYHRENDRVRLSDLYETISGNTYMNNVTRERALAHIKAILTVPGIEKE